MTYPFPGLRKRYHEYYYADGLNELARGVSGALTGGFMLTLVVKDPSTTRVIVGMALVTVMIAFDILEKRILGAIRERISYPRIGLVEPITLAEAGLHRRRAVILVSFVLVQVLVIGGSLLIVFGVIRIPNPFTMPSYWIPAVMALGLGAASIHEGLHLAGRRHAIGMGVIIVAFGIALSVADPGLFRGLSFLMLGWALMCVLSGAVTLWRFTHSPLPAEPADA